MRIPSWADPPLLTDDQVVVIGTLVIPVFIDEPDAATHDPRWQSVVFAHLKLPPALEENATKARRC